MRLNKRQRQQLDDLAWAGRAKALGLPQDKARKQAQINAEIVARTTARLFPSPKRPQLDAMAVSKAALSAWVASATDKAMFAAFTAKRPARAPSPASALWAQALTGELSKRSLFVQLCGAQD